MIIIFLEMLWFLAVDLIVNCQLCNKITRNYHKINLHGIITVHFLMKVCCSQKVGLIFCNSPYFYTYICKSYFRKVIFINHLSVFFSILTLLFRAKLVAWHTIDIRGKTLVICTYWSWNWYIVEIVKSYRKSEIISTN